jgi:HAE1 family hydrophobic/amphiphilic exporter-1
VIAFFIRRPVFASVCAILIVLGGAIAIPTLPVAQYPQLALPQVIVTSVYIGANARTVETSVTTPLEQVLNGVEGMKYIQSTSSNEGVSIITITFAVERDVDLAAVDVQNRVNQALGRLPAEVRATGINVQKSATGFVFGVGLYAEDGLYSNLFLSNYIDVYLRDAIRRVPGVSDVRIFGERRYAMRVWLDPARLAARDLTAADVAQALREHNLLIAAGQLGGAPSPPGQQIQISVRALGRLADPEAFERLILKSAPDGTLVLLKDVGRAELGAEDYSTVLRYNGQEALGFGVLPLPDANALDVEREARAALAELAESFPPGLKYAIAFNPTTAVRASIREVLITLGLAIVIVILVIFLFLQRLRSTLIPAITIPVSLVGTFVFVKLFDFSINNLTLFGLTLATGLVVDDAIVVIENIERHMAEEGVTAREAATGGMREVAGAVVATSLVLIAVFVPVALFPGTTGRIYQQFSLTIAFSIALSSFNALTLSPALAALLVRRVDPPRRGFFHRFDRGLARMNERYRRLLHRSLGHKLLVAGVFVAALVATLLVYRAVPGAFVPDEDQGYLILNVQGPPGASLRETLEVTTEVEEILRRTVPEMAGVFNVNGFSFTGAGANKATLFVSLRPIEERTGAAHSAMAILDRLRGPLAGVTGALVIPFLPPAIQGVGAFGGFQLEVQDRAFGDVERLAAATYALMGAAAGTPEVRGVFSGFSANDPQVMVEIDREKARSLGVSFDQVAAALGVYIGSVYVNDFDFNNRSYRVYAQADAPFRAHPGDLRQLYVRSGRGQMIPLDALVRIELTTAPQTITHFNLFRAAEINGSAAPGVSSTEALTTMERLAARVLPRGMGVAWAGIAREQLEAGGQALVIFFLGILVAYLVLAAQYESLVLPFTIMLAVPLAILGALLLQWARGYANDVFCQVGLVMLVGLAAKNAILIVEFAEQLRRRGLSIAEAAIEASRLRLRPILMTSLAFILGVLPLVFATGAGQNARRSLGTTVFGGMVVSTVLNLVFIPVLYVLIESARQRGFSRSRGTRPRT